MADSNLSNLGGDPMANPPFANIDKSMECLLYISQCPAWYRCQWQEEREQLRGQHQKSEFSDSR